MSKSMPPSEITALPFRDFLSRLGLTQAELSRRYRIPIRTIENWCSGCRRCAPWVMLLLAESQGLYKP